MDSGNDSFWQKNILYIPISAPNWNSRSLFCIFPHAVLLTRSAHLHSLHLPKSHSFFWGQFNSYSFLGSEILKSQNFTHTSSVANNWNKLLQVKQQHHHKNLACLQKLNELTWVLVTEIILSLKLLAWKMDKVLKYLHMLYNYS